MINVLVMACQHLYHHFNSFGTQVSFTHFIALIFEVMQWLGFYFVTWK